MPPPRLVSGLFLATLRPVIPQTEWLIHLPSSLHIARLQGPQSSFAVGVCGYVRQTQRRKKVHVAYTFRPDSQRFRSRCRRFPNTADRSALLRLRLKALAPVRCCDNWRRPLRNASRRAGEFAHESPPD